MKNGLLLSGCALLLAGAMATSGGCGSSSGGTGGAGGSTSGNSTTSSKGHGPSSSSKASSSTGTNTPPPPTLGAQIDRFGRPAINTALNHAFDGNTGTAGTAKDAWNQDANEAGWPATYGAEVATNLAILDSVDGVCGNQLLAKPEPTPGVIPADRYAPLAGLLSDDRMFIKTDAATCTTYLAVEANAANIIPNADCGGRKLSFDVIDETYSVVVLGSVAGTGDGVPADADTAGTTFPYLAAPH